MTNAQFNRKIKRLLKDWKTLSSFLALDLDNYFEQKELLKKEFLGIYSMDREMRFMNATSLRIMIRMNLILRAVPFHHFGIDIEL